MTEHSGFGAMLAWLLEYKEIGVQELGDRTSSTVDEVQAVFAGQPPGSGLLRQLAPVLGLNAVDLFILAGLGVPDDLAPLDAAAEQWAPKIMMDAVHLHAAARGELLELIRALPQAERLSPFAPKRFTPPTNDPGNLIVRMLQYRNLNWTGMAHALAVVTPIYLSAATYGVIGAGRKELTPRLVTGFAALLGIDARELAGVTGVDLRETPPSSAPEAVDAAVLLWETRRLSADQARHVSEVAHSMREEPRNVYFINLPCT